MPPRLTVMKSKLLEPRLLVQGHTSCRWASRDSNQDYGAPKSILIPFILCFLLDIPIYKINLIFKCRYYP